jgi:hypothetical protein
LPIKGSDELKQTNEIGMFIPVMESLDIADKTITGDALLTQRKVTRKKYSPLILLKFEAE